MRRDPLYLIEDGVIDQDLAFGVLRARELVIFEEPGLTGTLRVTHARRPCMLLYRLYVEDELAGTIHARRQLPNWYHCTGWLVGKPYRGVTVAEALPGMPPGPKGCTAAALLLHCYTQSLREAGIQLTSECLNGNVPSWKGFERAGWTMLTTEEVETYAECRRKGIKRMFSVEGGQAVQWKHTRDDAYDRDRWSSNRVYGIKPDDRPFVFMARGRSRLVEPLRAALSVIFLGSPLLLLRHKLKRKVRRQSARPDKDEAGRLLDLGRSHLRAGSLGEAVQALRRGIELRPRAVWARGLLARALAQTGELEEAVAVAREAAAMAPDYGPAHETLASLYVELGEHEKAVEHVERAVACGVTPPEELLERLKPFRASVSE